MDPMFVICPTINQDVIKEYDNKFAKARGKCDVHCSLECAGSAGETECHDSKLELTEVSLKGRLIFFSSFERNLVETCSQV